MDEALVGALSELAVTVQRERTVDGVLETAKRGLEELGMRFVAFDHVDAHQNAVVVGGRMAIDSSALTRADAAALSLFATHVGLAIELAERERLAALGELAAVVAHEIRNPLGILFNSLGQLTKLVPEQGDARTLLSIATDESRRLNRIVTDLLELARPFKLVILPSPLADLLRELAVDPRIALHLDEALPPIDMDDGYMRQALTNLLTNALQALPSKGGSVTVRAAMAAGENRLVRVDITDTGPGLLGEAHQRLFEPFFTTKVGGTGLGLTIVKRIVDAHGAEISVASSPRGTTFSLLLPVARESWPEPAPSGVRRNPLLSATSETEECPPQEQPRRYST